MIYFELFSEPNEKKPERFLSGASSFLFLPWFKSFQKSAEPRLPACPAYMFWEQKFFLWHERRICDTISTFDWWYILTDVSNHFRVLPLSPVLRIPFFERGHFFLPEPLYPHIHPTISRKSCQYYAKENFYFNRE